MLMKYLPHIILILSVLLFSGCARISPPRGVKPTEKIIEATGYCKCGKCCGWHRKWGHAVDNVTGKRKKVGLTASGRIARRGTIAADTRKYPFGTVMFIEGYGYGRVEDRGGAIKGNRIDLFFQNHRQALKWGRK
ncbi:MAG: 3D domain-containing protein, partial [Kiritimatiellae bacterium]|nr:3D domain-containing protein [Kiritimatiellia bacterium]